MTLGTDANQRDVPICGRKICQGTLFLLSAKLYVFVPLHPSDALHLSLASQREEGIWSALH